MLRTGRSGLQDTQWLENMKHTILQIIIILIHVLAVTSVHFPLGCVQTEKSIVLKTCKGLVLVLVLAYCHNHVQEDEEDEIQARRSRFKQNVHVLDAKTFQFTL